MENKGVKLFMHATILTIISEVLLTSLWLKTKSMAINQTEKIMHVQIVYSYR
jgi:hypothetical protein